MNSGRNQLMKRIYETGLAIDDTVLYLDTHPDDNNALAYYKKMKGYYKQACNEYAALYGPLLIEQVEGNRWTWGETPWPWEKEGC